MEGTTNIQVEECIQIDVDEGRKIQKVSQLFRRLQSSDGCYDPLVVSIGPYHHGKPELKEMERHKFSYAMEFCEKLLQEMLEKVAKEAKEARELYSDGSDLDGDKFVRMMVVDGCFILRFISLFLDGNTGLKPHVEGLVTRDLFLLENQIPYSFLMALMTLKRYEKKKITEFLKFVRQSRPDQQRAEEPNGQDEKISTVHLLQLFHSQFTERWPEDRSPNKEERGTWHCYRSASELRNVGIHFRLSKSRFFTDVEYESNILGGFLSLPPIVVHDLTKSLLLNLVAYETCPTTPNNELQISSYIVFMDSLIDHAEDVKELRSKGILVNSLGSDQEVANLFNEISLYLMLHPKAFPAVRDGIENRYQNKGTKWMAQWINDHFSSPWTILAFAAAVFGLALTAIQTYVSIYPLNNGK